MVRVSITPGTLHPTLSSYLTVVDGREGLPENSPSAGEEVPDPCLHGAEGSPTRRYAVSASPSATEHVRVSVRRSYDVISSGSGLQQNAGERRNDICIKAVTERGSVVLCPLIYLKRSYPAVDRLEGMEKEDGPHRG